jgi:hypothetical protein
MSKIDYEKMMNDSIAEIRELRKKKPADFKTRRLIQLISTPEHLLKIHEGKKK